MSASVLATACRARVQQPERAKIYSCTRTIIHSKYRGVMALEVVPAAAGRFMPPFSTSVPQGEGSMEEDPVHDELGFPIAEQHPAAKTPATGASKGGGRRIFSSRSGSDNGAKLGRQWAAWVENRRQSQCGLGGAQPDERSLKQCTKLCRQVHTNTQASPSGAQATFVLNHMVSIRASRTDCARKFGSPSLRPNVWT